MLPVNTFAVTLYTRMMDRSKLKVEADSLGLEDSISRDAGTHSRIS
jgi:hypothetical protein